MLKIREQYRAGKAKYLVNFCVGGKHKDGSDFYELRIFKNKVLKDRFIKKLWEDHALTHR